MIIRAGSQIFLLERIVAIEIRTNPRKPGWPEQHAAQVVVDAGRHGIWISLNDAEWAEFQSHISKLGAFLE